MSGMDLDRVVSGGARPCSGAREGRRYRRHLFCCHGLALVARFGLQGRGAEGAAGPPAAPGRLAIKPACDICRATASSARGPLPPNGRARDQPVFMGAELLLAQPAASIHKGVTGDHQTRPRSANSAYNRSSLRGRAIRGSQAHPGGRAYEAVPQPHALDPGGLEQLPASRHRGAPSPGGAGWRE